MRACNVDMARISLISSLGTRWLRAPASGRCLSGSSASRESRGHERREKETAHGSASSGDSEVSNGPARAAERETPERTASFGFQEVPAEEKSSRVRGVFDSVAQQYDVMNDLMSGGMHRLWKRSFVAALGPTPDMQIIDVAGGTGDISFRVVDRVRSLGGLQHPIRVIDASPAMIEVGGVRALERGYDAEVKFEVGDAERLENVADESVDAYLISFGMRNVTDPAAALKEAYRTLRRGGRFMMLEFGKVEDATLEQLYNTYSFNVIPAIGEAVARDRPAYQYLVESIRRFPSQRVFSGMMETAGFSTVRFRNYTFGVVAQYSGFKL